MKKGGLADSPFFTKNTAWESRPSPPPAAKAAAGEKQNQPAPVDRGGGQSTNRPTDQSTDQSIDRSTGESTAKRREPPIDVETLGPIVARPRAFYITGKVDAWLDEAVGYLKAQGLHKADRSVLINALLHDPALFIPAALDALRARLLAHLTNKAIKKIESTD